MARQGLTEKVTSEWRGKSSVLSKEKRTEQGHGTRVHLFHGGITLRPEGLELVTLSKGGGS